MLLERGAKQRRGFFLLPLRRVELRGRSHDGRRMRCLPEQVIEQFLGLLEVHQVEVESRERQDIGKTRTGCRSDELAHRLLGTEQVAATIARLGKPPQVVDSHVHACSTQDEETDAVV